MAKKSTAEKIEAVILKYGATPITDPQILKKIEETRASYEGAFELKRKMDQACAIVDRNMRRASRRG